MNIKIGANPTSWINNNLTTSASGLSFDKWLSDISLIGYQGLELEEPFMKVIDKLGSLLNEKNLSCIGKLHETYILDRDFNGEIKRLEEHINMLKSLKADVVILSERILTKNRLKRADDWKRLCLGLEIMSRMISENGLKCAYHPHMETYIQNDEDIDILMNNTKNIGLLFDTSHLVLAGVDPFTILKKYISRITHVHLTSVVLEKDSTAIEDILHCLMEADYQGWVVMEAGKTTEDTDHFSSALTGYETVHSLLTKSEFALM